MEHRLLIRIAEHDGITSVVLVDDKDSHGIPLVVGGLHQALSADDVRADVINAVENVLATRGPAAV